MSNDKHDTRPKGKKSKNKKKVVKRILKVKPQPLR